MRYKLIITDLYNGNSYEFDSIEEFVETDPVEIGLNRMDSAEDILNNEVASINVRWELESEY